MTNIESGPQQQPNITIETNLYGKPIYAEKLGHLCAAWANLEWLMYLLFQDISGSPVPIAQSIFYAIESNRGRRDILAAVGSLAIERPGDKTELDDIIRRIGRCATQRNKYVHDTWCVAQTQNNEVLQMRLSAPKSQRNWEEITVKDIDNTTGHIQTLCEELDAFRSKISPSLPSSLQRLREQPGIALRYAKKGHPPGRKLKGHHGQR